MKLEAIPKDGTTLTRKAFWDKVLEVVNASQKKEGKNVSVDVHDGYGTVINAMRVTAGGAPNTCAGSCVLPAADCPHALCFEVNPGTETLSDGYWDSGYIAALRDGEGNDVIRPYIYIYDSGGGAYKAGAAAASTFWTGPSIEVPMTLEQFFGNWHCVIVKLSSSDGASMDVTLNAYGLSASSTETFVSGDNTFADRLFVGSKDAFPGPVDLQIRSIRVLGNPDPSASCPESPIEDDFIFPDDSFDTTVGSGQSISGDTILVLSSDGLENGYLKNFGNFYNLRCEDTLFRNRITISPSGNMTDCFTYSNDTPQSVIETDLDPCSSDDAGFYDCRYISTGGTHNHGGNTDLTFMSTCDNPSFPFQLGLNKILAEATLRDSKTTLRITCATEYACEPTEGGTGGCEVTGLSDFIDVSIPYQNPTGIYEHTFSFSGGTYSFDINIRMEIYPFGP